MIRPDQSSNQFQSLMLLLPGCKYVKAISSNLLAAVLRTVLCFYSRIREALTCPRIFTTPKDIDISRWSRSQTHFCACWRSVIHCDRCPRGSCWIQDKEVAQMILPRCLLCQVMSRIFKLGSAVILQSIHRNLRIKGTFHYSCSHMSLMSHDE